MEIYKCFYRNVISAILIPAECYPCSENIAGTINQSFVIESRITSFSRASLPRAREDPGLRLSDWNRIPFLRHRHSSVFSRRILLYLPLVPFCSRAAVFFRLSHAVLWERRDSRGGTERGWAVHERTKTTKWRSKVKK